MTPYERALHEHLRQFVTPDRLARFEAAVGSRTRQICVAVADLFQQHNASAVLRTCEAMGIQNVRICEVEFPFDVHPKISMGTERWLTVTRHHGPDAMEECLTQLKSEGYRIVATTPQQPSDSIDDLPLDAPVALFFGTEKEGLPPQILDRADGRVHVPMVGLADSYNVSVAVALSLQTLLRRLKASRNDWQLSQAERETLLQEWVRTSVTGADAIERRFAQEWTEDDTPPRPKPGNSPSPRGIG